MKIRLDDIGKRFQADWIFRHLNYEFSSEHAYVILGANGSGKSTLLQILTGNSSPAEGKITYEWQDKNIPVEEVYRYLSLAAPYLDLFEEFTLLESVKFHQQFQPFRGSIDTAEAIEIMQLEKARNKQLRHFSSGMRQRVKLGLSLLSDTPLLFLDEPTNNLDPEAIEWYGKLVEAHRDQRLIVVCSNRQHHEYFFCDQELRIESFKPKGKRS